MKIGVSGCLVGENCRYDGSNCFNRKVYEFISSKEYFTICPEVIGGLGIPRKPCEIVKGSGEDVLEGKGKVIDIEGNDLTEKYIEMAYKTLEIFLKNKAKLAILKSKSPACGKGKIYDGSFSGKLKKGNGVVSAILMKNGIEVITEEEIEEKMRFLTENE